MLVQPKGLLDGLCIWCLMKHEVPCDRRSGNAACWLLDALPWHVQSGWEHTSAEFLLNSSFRGVVSASAMLTEWGYVGSHPLDAS